MIRPALEALAGASVAFATRGEQPIDDPPPGGDVDILVGARDAAAAERVLEAHGFRRLAAPGHRRHRFFLAFDHARGRWLKIDVALVPVRFGWDLSARDARSLERFARYRVGTKANPGALERVWSRAQRRRPLGLRRRGPVVAVLGPDGAGKGSVIAALRREIPVGLTPLYFGHGGESQQEYASRPARGPGRAASAGRRAARAARAALALLPPDLRAAQHHARRAVVSALRVWVAYPYAWRGDIVLCDRHPLEGLAVNREDRTLGGRLERRLLRTLAPWPDAVVLLDAPGEVLFARKGEHGPSVLERWRAAYQEVFAGPRTTVVATTDGLEAAVAASSAAVWRALCERRGW